MAIIDLLLWAENQIRNYVNSGYKAKVPGGQVTQDDWTGVGYVFWKDQGCACYLLQGSIGGGETTEPFIWGGWNDFWFVVCGWQDYYPDIGAEAHEAIPCDLCSTRVQWIWPPDSSVWAWGESIPVARYDTLFWEGEEPDPLGPDTCWFYSEDYDPNIYTLKAEIFGPYPPGSENDPIWHFGGDSLRFWVVKVEIDTTRSSMLFEVPLEGEEGVQDTAQTVFTILPDTSFFESPVMDSLRFLHYVTTETEGGAIDTVKSKWLFELDTLEMLEAGEKPYWVVQWLQQDDDEEWLDPEDNPFKSHIRMEWINRDEETRQMTRHNGEEDHRAEGNAIDLLVYLPDGSQLPEAAEQGDGSGMLVKLNDDHDAGQESPDWELEQVSGENDLVRIEIKPILDEQGVIIRAGKLVLEIAKPQGEGGGMGDLLEKVKVWKHRQKGRGNLLIGGDEPPAKTWDLTSGEDVEELMKFVGNTASETLWVEGCKEPSERLKEWRLVLTLEDEQGSKAEEDEVEGTVIQIDNVWALSNADNAAVFSDNPTPDPVAHDRAVTLRAVVQVTPEPEEGFAHYWAAGDGQASIGGQTITVKQRGANWPRLDIKWNVFLPHMQHVTLPGNDPAQSGSYQWYTNAWTSGTLDGKWLGYDGVNGGQITEESGLDDVIEYAQVHIWNGWEVVLANIVGTTRYRIAECMSKYTAGKEDAETRCNLVYQEEDDCYDRGVMSSVLRIMRRSSDASMYLSCLDAYTGVPWIYGSCCHGGAQTPAPPHQTERFVGFDCADLVVGGARLAGLTTIDYCGAHELAVTYLQPRGNYGWLYMLPDGTIHSHPSGDEVVIPIGDGPNDLHVGDVVLFDWGERRPNESEPYKHGDDKCDHAIVFLEDFDSDEQLSGTDRFIWADHPGITKDVIPPYWRNKYHRFVLRHW